MLASSMYLMTSLYEGFPMVLVETAAIGLPCVCTTCPCGPAEFIRDGVDGMLAAPGDIDGMADKICTLIEQPELRRSMGREINKKAADFTPDRILDQWDRLFRRLATSE
jgi:glycosyltransferase involved in cell wall biosynthesis